MVKTTYSHFRYWADGDLHIIYSFFVSAFVLPIAILVIVPNKGIALIYALHAMFFPGPFFDFCG